MATIVRIVDNVTGKVNDVKLLSLSYYDWEEISKTGKYTIPEGVTIIGAGAFANSLFLKEVNLNGVKEVMSGAFSRCEKLERVTNFDSLEVVEPNAFFGCNNLDELFLQYTDDLNSDGNGLKKLSQDESEFWDIK